MRCACFPFSAGLLTTLTGAEQLHDAGPISLVLNHLYNNVLDLGLLASLRVYQLRLFVVEVDFGFLSDLEEHALVARIVALKLIARSQDDSTFIWIHSLEGPERCLDLRRLLFDGFAALLLPAGSAAVLLPVIGLAIRL